MMPEQGQDAAKLFAELLETKRQAVAAVQAEKTCCTLEHSTPADPQGTGSKKYQAGQALQRGEIDEAIGIYLQILDQEPDDGDSLTALGNIATSLGRHGEAQVFYRNALALEPWNSLVREKLAALPEIPVEDIEGLANKVASILSSPR